MHQPTDCRGSLVSPVAVRAARAKACRATVATMIAPWRTERGELVLDRYRIHLLDLLREDAWEAHLAGNRFMGFSGLHVVTGSPTAVTLVRRGVLR